MGAALIPNGGGGSLLSGPAQVLGSLTGGNGGAGGTGFAGPANANIMQPTTADQAGKAYTGTLDSFQAQQALLKALQAQNGLQNQNNVYGQLQNIASGQGPNPAQAMLNQATGTNVANQAALMAGQRGAGANVGLLARQAALQGAGIQQQAVGEGATMQAQQALAAIGQAGQLANTQAGQQIGQVNTNTQSQQQEQQNLLNSIAQQNNANVGMQSNINQANADLANTQLKGQQKLIGGGLNALGSAGGGGAAAAAAATAFAEGGSTDVAQLGTPGGINNIFDRSLFANKMANGGMTHDYRAGGGVTAQRPKEKAVQSGNSYANDKIQAVLSEHEIVIPRSITMGKDPVSEGAKFIAKELLKRKKG